MAVAEAHRRPRRTDAIVAACCTALSLGLLIAFPAIVAPDPDPGSGAPVLPPVLGVVWWVTALALVAQAGALLAARHVPRVTAILVAGVGCGLDVVAPSAMHGLTVLTVMAAVVLAVLRVPLRRLWLSLASVTVLVVAGETAAGIGDEKLAPLLAIGQALLQPIVVVAAPTVVALLVRSQRELRRALRAEQSAAERERDARVAEAVARERAAMARELHDIAAHHLSGIALMLGVVDRQIDSDPLRAHTGVRQVREQTGSVLDDLRRLVGLLRDDGAAERSVETLAAIPELVERARRHGVVELRVLDDARRDRDGEPVIGAGVGPLAQLAAYRTVQEALANVALHAAGAECVVRIDDRDPRAVTVSVRNGPPPAGARTPPDPGSGGYGLRGMRERADLVGATLRTGPSDDDGWSVELVIARETAGVEEAS
jgi:signal transduction histidine kinase